MIKLLCSRFETYLLDEEKEVERFEEMDLAEDYLYREEYPAGFFTSL